MPLLSRMTNKHARGGSTGDFLFLPASELAALPTSGGPYVAMKAVADSTWEATKGISNHDGIRGAQALSAALVYVKTGTGSYKTKVVDAVRDVIGMENVVEDSTNTYLGTARQFAGYIMAADLVDMDPTLVGTNALRDSARLSQTFLQWVDFIRLEKIGAHAVFNNFHCNDDRINNQGAMGLMARAAADIYCQKHSVDAGPDLVNVANILRRVCGNRSYHHQFKLTSSSDSTYICLENSQMANPPNPTATELTTKWVAINPSAANSNCQGTPNKDGSVINDISRSVGAFPTWDSTGLMYSWGALRGFMGTACLLVNHGYSDVWTWSGSAFLRAVQWLNTQATDVPAEADKPDWLVFLVESRYGVSLPHTGGNFARTIAAGPHDQSFGYSDWWA